MLKIPGKLDELKEWLKDLVDEMTATSEERGLVYTRAAQVCYNGAVSGYSRPQHLTTDLLLRSRPWLNMKYGNLFQDTRDMKPQIWEE